MTPMPACPISAYSPAGPFGSGTRSQPKGLSFGKSEARLIWVMVIAALPAKKSTVSPGPGMAFLLKMASWMNDRASAIGFSAMVQVAPSALQGDAPQPFHTEVRYCQLW
ncbi:hypothetical protein D3C80_1899880 [compost metagenome]